MSTKKLLSSVLAVITILASCLMFCAQPVAAEVAEIPWSEYDELIKEIKAETDFAAREGLMHQAEDMLMETCAVIPLYYYNAVFMAKEGLTGYFLSPQGNLYFRNVEYPDHDVVKINLSSEPEKLDPGLVESTDGHDMALNLFSGLYTYDAEGNLVPDMAEGVEVSEDGLTYVFTLRDDLKWSDGDPITAHDFEYSWKRAVNWLTASGYSYVFDVIEGFPEAPEDIENLTQEDADQAAEGLQVKASADGKTLTVKLKAPCAYFLSLTAFSTYFPVKEAALENAEGYRDADGKIAQPGVWCTEAGFPCCGPYMVTEWKHKESITLSKNPNYQHADEVKTERLEFMLTNDASISYAAYQAGELDFINSIPSDEIKGLKESNSTEFHKVDVLGTEYFVFNVGAALFDGKTKEQAIAMRRGFSKLIDRQYVIDTVMQMDQTPANTFIPPVMSDGHGGEFRKNSDVYTYPDAENLGYFDTEVDVEGAIECFKEAGYKFDDDGMLSDENPISFVYLVNDKEQNIKKAECFQQDFAYIGIDMKISKIDWATFHQERQAGNFTAARANWQADFNDPINMLEMWQSTSGNNTAQFGKPINNYK